MINWRALLRHHMPLMALAFLVCLFFVFYAAQGLQWRYIRGLENVLYDARVVLTMPRDVDPRVVIVDIDEKSLAEVGRWPWGRNRLAKLLDELFDYYGAGIVGLDVVFREPDRSSGLMILERLAETEFEGTPGFRDRLEQLRPVLDFDQMFVRSLEGRLVVLGYYFNPGREGEDRLEGGMLPPPVLSADDLRERSVYAVRAQGYGANIAEIAQAAAASGHITPAIDDDGYVRRVPMLIEYEGGYYEAFSLAIVRQLLGVDRVEPVYGETAGRTGYPELEALQIGYNSIPVDFNVQALVPFRGPSHSFPYASAVDVMRGRVDRELLKDAIVLVGTTAQTLLDLRTTPVQKEYPGVEIHANLIAGILDGTIKSQPAYTRAVEVLQLLLVGLLLSLLLPRLSPSVATVTAAIVMAVAILINFAFWQYANLVVPLAGTLLMIVIIFILSMSYGFFIERRGKRQIAALFGQYVPPELVEEMRVDPEAYTLEAENREMTVLFSDVRGFTSLSEGLGPGDLAALMNEYLTAMTRLIHEHRGTIDKYMGDAIMAFWGAPLSDAQHARHALETGMAMLERLNAISDDFRERGWPEIRIGVGLNTGVMSVGNMGSQFRMAYTVMGDAVNLGSRLEGLTKSYGAEIIVSESTRAAVPDYVYRELDVVRVKGRDLPLAIYEPIARPSEMSDKESEDLVRYERALECFRGRDWDGAEAGFRRLAGSGSRPVLCELYLERIAAFRENPPGPDWDGVYTHTSK